MKSQTHESELTSKNMSPALFVDLDGTLIKTDLLIESFFTLIKSNPFLLFFILPWLFKGRAFLKHQIASRIEIDPSILPYNSLFLEFIRSEAQKGRQIILATSANEKLARQVADYLGVFQNVLASNSKVNLTGKPKLEAILKECKKEPFDYAGNAKVDLEIWPHAQKAILVNPEAGVRKRAEMLVDEVQVFEDCRPGLSLYLRALRLHQWLKNLLVFIPLFMAHQFHDPKLVIQAVLAFFAFGLVASSVYLLNDLLDLPADRQHPTKRNRPLAAGAIPVKLGVLLIPLLLLAALMIALWLPTAFLLFLALYYVLTLAYSFRLKQVLIVDVLALGGLYTVRLIAGAAAVTVEPSFWLLAFAMFLFFSLALVKRYSELLELRKENKQFTSGRGYRVGDLETIAQFGANSGFMAVLVLALYINSDKIISLYTHPKVIWLLCPLLLYWVSRVWLMAHRGQIHEDPVVFAIKDRRSHWIVLIGIITIWVAI